LQKAGYDIIRVTEKLPATASDVEIVRLAYQEKAAIITQDLDFFAIVAQSGLQGPSVVSLRVANAKSAVISAILKKVGSCCAGAQQPTWVVTEKHKKGKRTKIVRWINA